MFLKCSDFLNMTFHIEIFGFHHFIMGEVCALIRAFKNHSLCNKMPYLIPVTPIFSSYKITTF